MNNDKVKECFGGAKKDDAQGKKHRGLLITKPNRLLAEDYILKAKKNLEFCEFYKNQGVDYKLPEEWFYTLYYCALAILSKFAVESRSQRCTAAFLHHVKNKGLIEYDSEFIDMSEYHPCCTGGILSMLGNHRFPACQKRIAFLSMLKNYA